MSKNTIITIVLVVLAGGIGFFAGSKYQSSKTSAFGNRIFANGQKDGNGQFQRGNNIGNGNGMRNGGGVVGEITAADDKSITVKMPDGSSKIIIFTDKTTVSKSTDGIVSDLKTGENVAVFGATNSDGSVTATNIQLNPQFRMIGLTGTPAAQK